MSKELLFKLITTIRFPMIFGIVLIHSQNNNFITNENNLALYNFLTNLFSNGIARICVPLFYLISGFLFFYNITNWNYSTYFNKIKSRIYTLLIPYILYTTLAIIFFGIFQKIIPQLLSGDNIPIWKWNFIDFINAYWKYNNNIPFVGPLWFIRNLMIMVLMSPFIFWFINKIKVLGIIALGIIWITGVHEFSIPGSMALFFFCLGAYYGILKKDFTKVFYNIKLANIYPIFLICDIFSKDEAYNEYLHRITVILGVIFFIKIMTNIVLKKTINIPRVFVTSSFFIYA